MIVEDLFHIVEVVVVEISHVISGGGARGRGGDSGKTGSEWRADWIFTGTGWIVRGADWIVRGASWMVRGADWISTGSKLTVTLFSGWRRRVFAGFGIMVAEKMSVMKQVR